MPAAAHDRPGGRTRRVSNRQVRNWPSAVRRTRSQSPQNGFVTLGMTPTSPRPSSVAPAIGGRGAAGRQRSSGYTAEIASTISSCDDHLSSVPRTRRVERHELDEAHARPCVASERGEVDDLVVVDAALEHDVDLHRVEPGLLGGVDAVEHARRARRAGSCATKRSRRSESREMLTPPRPAPRRSSASSRKRGAVGRHRQVDVERAASLATSSGRWARTVGSPPVRRIAVDAEALDEHPGDPLDLLERQQLAARQPLHALLRHAVGAAEVAAIGDRDAQVTHGAAVGIDQIDGIVDMVHGIGDARGSG